jgi:5-formyltetrahydrofolate cyclo-ligase
MNSPSSDAASEPVLAKRQWRRSILAAIAQLDPDDRRAQESSLVAAFATLPGWAEARTVLLYVTAFAEEIGTAPLLSLAYGAGKRVALPRVDRSERRLRLHAVSDLQSELTPGGLGILEPVASRPEIPADEIDWALVPGVAFDDRGYRLGRGAGHYDRLLPAMRPDCVCWALCLGCQLVPGIPVEPHDVPLDGITAPHRTIRGVGRSGGFRGSSRNG